jgi:hypothetical protein
VAQRLDLPLLDRAITTEIAAQLQVSVEEAEGGAFKRSAVSRILGVLAPLAGGVLGAGTDAAPGDAVPLFDDTALFRDQADAIMRDALTTGAVILGRGGSAAFRDAPDVLRVRLFGTRNARIAHAMRIQQIDTATAEQRLPEVDNARSLYVRRVYGVDIDDPELFALQIDSTVLTSTACADLIATAYRALTAT